MTSGGAGRDPRQIEAEKEFARMREQLRRLKEGGDADPAPPSEILYPEEKAVEEAPAPPAPAPEPPAESVLDRLRALYEDEDTRRQWLRRAPLAAATILGVVALLGFTYGVKRIMGGAESAAAATAVAEPSAPAARSDVPADAAPAPSEPLTAVAASEPTPGPDEVAFADASEDVSPLPDEASGSGSAIDDEAVAPAETAFDDATLEDAALEDAALEDAALDDVALDDVAGDAVRDGSEVLRAASESEASPARAAVSDAATAPSIEEAVVEAAAEAPSDSDANAVVSAAVADISDAAPEIIPLSTEEPAPEPAASVVSAAVEAADPPDADAPFLTAAVSEPPPAPAPPAAETVAPDASEVDEAAASLGAAAPPEEAVADADDPDGLPGEVRRLFTGLGYDVEAPGAQAWLKAAIAAADFAKAEGLADSNIDDAFLAALREATRNGRLGAEGAGEDLSAPADQVRAAETLLAFLGYPIDRIDGELDGAARAALVQFGVEHGLADINLDGALLALLREEAARLRERGVPE